MDVFYLVVGQILASEQEDASLTTELWFGVEVSTTIITPYRTIPYFATIIIIVEGSTTTTIIAITFAATKIPTIDRSIDQQSRLLSTSSAHFLFSPSLGPSTTARLVFANANYCNTINPISQLRLPFMVLTSVFMFQVSLTSRLLPSHQVIRTGPNK